MLWAGQIVSLLGDWFTLIATATLVARMTSSGVAVGGLFVVRMLAPFLVSPLAGLAADRHNRKHLLILADVLRAVVALGFLFVREPSEVWVLYVLTALQLGLSGVFFPARNALLPSLVSDAELGAANALSSAAWSVMFALGTALGGFIAGWFGLYTAFLLDAATFLVSALAIAQIRYDARQDIGESAASGASGLRLYAEGLGYLRRHLDILSVVLLKPAFALTVAGAASVLRVTIGERIFPIGENGAVSMGLVFAAAGVGTGIGPIAARAITRDRESSMCVAIALGFAMIVFGLALASTLVHFPVVLVGFCIEGTGGGIMWVFSTQLLMRNVPAEMRGRVFGTEFALFTLMCAVSAAWCGQAIDLPALGVQRTLCCVAALALLPGGLWSLYVWRRIRR